MNFIIVAFIVLIASFSGPSYAADQARSTDAASIDAVARSPQWLRLLHFRKGFWNFKASSEIDGPGFFFSPDGKNDPRAELLASIDAFSKDIKVGKYQVHPQCAFPERYRFVKQDLNLKIQDVPCPKFDEFMNRFDAESVSVVFSSAYPNNPASMFGHTFLKINSKKKSELLDYGISYAAVVSDDENPFAFMWFGLTGGYVGQFSVLPYYSKVNEYVNSESRDLWEYELSLTRDETRRLLAHLWEIEANSWSDYYFFDENCSYEILAALEVVKPNWNLTHWGPHVIPGETTKELMKTPGAVRAVHLRPSLRSRLFQHFEAMRPEERREFASFRDKKLLAQDIQSPLTADTAAIYIQYERQASGGHLPKDEEARFVSVLNRRSQLGDEAKEVDPRLPPFSEDSRPDLGHHPYRLSAAPGVMTGPNGEGQRFFQDLSFKFAYHDLMNRDLGFTRSSQIDFPSIRLRYVPQDHLVNVEEVTAVEVTSLFPLTFLEKKPSWRFALGSYSPKDFGCLYCHVGHLEAGGGLTLELWTPRAIFYAFGLGQYDLGDSFAKGYRIGPAAEAAFLLNPWNTVKFHLRHRIVWDLFQDERQDRFSISEAEASLSVSPEWEVRAGTSLITPSRPDLSEFVQSELSLNYYFR